MTNRMIRKIRALYMIYTTQYKATLCLQAQRGTSRESHGSITIRSPGWKKRGNWPGSLLTTTCSKASKAALSVQDQETWGLHQEWTAQQCYALIFSRLVLACFTVSFPASHFTIGSFIITLSGWRGIWGKIVPPGYLIIDTQRKERKKIDEGGIIEWEKRELCYP